MLKKIPWNKKKKTIKISAFSMAGQRFEMEDELLECEEAEAIILELIFSTSTKITTLCLMSTTWAKT